MKGYSSEIPENCTFARLEGVNASYKDLTQVCGVIRNKKTNWALEFLELAAEGEVPVFYRSHNKNLGHRRELGGRKGRYPQKAAKVVLKLLKNAISNGKNLGMDGEFTIFSACANKKEIYPRIAPKGRWARSFLETARVEIVLKGEAVPKGVTVTPSAKKAEAKETKHEAKSEAKSESKSEPSAKSGEKKPEPAKPQETAKAAEKEHKHEGEAKKDVEKPHQHAEHNKR